MGARRRWSTTRRQRATAPGRWRSAASRRMSEPLCGTARRAAVDPVAPRQIAADAGIFRSRGRSRARLGIGGADRRIGVCRGQVRALAAERVDAELLGWSYDFVGDLAETVSLIWPEVAAAQQTQIPSLAEIVERLRGAGRAE